MKISGIHYLRLTTDDEEKKGEQSLSLFLGSSQLFSEFAFEFLDHLGNDFLVVADNAECRCLEDGGIGIFVDRDDTI